LAWDKPPSDSTGTDTTLGIPHAVEIRISRCPHWTPAVVSNVFTHEDHYETALIDLINKKRAGEPIAKKERPAAGIVVNLMDALRASLSEAGPAKATKRSKKSTGQKEMLLPIEGKKPKEAAAKKTATRPSGSRPDSQRKPGPSRLSEKVSFAGTKNRSARVFWPPRSRRPRSFPARSSGRA
jgi:hypothetical protein